METLTFPFMELGFASAAREGETESGDRHLALTTPAGVLLAHADVVGNGAAAAMAAELALLVLRRYAGESPADILLHCHEALRGTRGVSMAVTAVDSAALTLTWAGVGHVCGLLVRGNPGPNQQLEALRTVDGMLGHRLPAIPNASLALEPGDTLVYSTVGIRGELGDEVLKGGSAKQIADRIMTRQRDKTEDALIVVARFRRVTP